MFKQASSVIKNITKLEGEFAQVNLTSLANFLLKLVPNLSIPDGSTLKITNINDKTNGSMIHVQSENALYYNEPFDMYINDNSYSLHRIDWYNIFKKQ